MEDFDGDDAFDGLLAVGLVTQFNHAFRVVFGIEAGGEEGFEEGGVVAVDARAGGHRP